MLHFYGAHPSTIEDVKKANWKEINNAVFNLRSGYPQRMGDLSNRILSHPEELGALQGFYPSDAQMLVAYTIIDGRTDY